MINLDDFKPIGTHWRALYVNGNNRRTSYDAIYFDSSEVEYIKKKKKTLTGNKKILKNIYRMQAYDSMMCGYFCIGLIVFMLIGKVY